jgi:hypothetical protein
MGLEPVSLDRFLVHLRTQRTAATIDATGVGDNTPIAVYGTFDDIVHRMHGSRLFQFSEAITESPDNQRFIHSLYPVVMQVVNRASYHDMTIHPSYFDSPSPHVNPSKYAVSIVMNGLSPTDRVKTRRNSLYGVSYNASAKFAFLDFVAFAQKNSLPFHLPWCTIDGAKNYVAYLPGEITKKK